MGAPWLDSIDDRYCNPHPSVIKNKNKIEIIFIHLELLVRTVRRD